MIHVYLLKDGNGKVVDVGESKNPPARLYKKTKAILEIDRKTNFYGRTDITLEVVSSHPTRKEARVEEGRLKLFYGLEWTENHRLGLPDSQRKLTKEIADEIRAKYIPYKYHTTMLAEEYGVHKSAIKHIISGQTYNV